MSGMFCAVAALVAQLAIYHDGWIDFNKNGVRDVYEDSSRPTDERVRDLLAQMTDDEKSCQLVTLYGSGRVLREALPAESWKNEIWKDGLANIDEELNGVGVCFTNEWKEMVYPFSNHVKALNDIQRWFVEETRLGIPVDFSNEGIHGLNHTKATPLPAPIGIGSTWNKDLVLRAGEIVGREAKLLGYSNVYAPILDVVRDPRWGRTLECYGESPFLIAELGKRMVLGIQSQGVAATLKHYAVYSVPKGGRDADCRTDPHVTPRELHQIFLYPFARVIREARPMGVMCSYNDWNGEPVAASHYFLTELLRETYGFAGYVVSDSDAVEFVHTKHQVAETYEDAVRQVLEAGLNVRTNFTPPDRFIKPLRKLLSEGRISRADVDRRVAEVLSVKFRLGLFDRPYGLDPEAADRLAGADRHQEFADDIQDQSLVLLKNMGEILPLDPAKRQRILVTGPLAADTSFMTSRYGPNGLEPISILQGIRDRVGTVAEVVYEKGCDTVNPGWPNSEVVPVPPSEAEVVAMDSAVKEAQASDVVIAVLGEDELTTGESRSRTALDLPGRQQFLLERLQATGKPVVLVLVNGQPLTINWANAFVPAILETWFPGVRGGRSVARALFGDLNPSGKLTVTFPKTVGQIEYNFPFKKGAHGRQNRLGDPNGDGVTRVVGALYPFGYGLSYTRFEYKNLFVTPTIGETGTVWKIAFDICNIGSRAGAEIVQLYVRDEYSSVVAYDSVLRGFEKVFLESGEEKRVSFELRPCDLAILDRNMNWTVEPGSFEVRIGASSEDIRLRQQVEVRPPLALVTYANPLDVSYHVRKEGEKYSDYCTPADPEIILHAGRYWLFASKSGGYFSSTNLANWTWIEHPDLPTDEWAPTVEEVGGVLHFTARAGTVHRATDLEKGRWEKLPHKVPGSVDSALFADGDRLYLYWGGDRGRNPVFGCELDPKTFAAKAKPQALFDVDFTRYGWEVRGDNNEQTDGYSYVEGAHMFARDGRYYLQYAASGTQFASYSDTALIGPTPLGPFRRQRTNPFSYKSTGYVPSAGHGKTFADRYGNVWHVTTGLVEDFNRRLVMFPVFFDADGEMWCDTAFGDWPFAVPDRKVSSPEELRTGWMELAEDKPAVASSAESGYPAADAVDGKIATFWSAASGRAGETLTVDFGRLATVRAIQVGFGGVVRTRVYRIEAQEADGSWRTVIDERAGRPYAEHPYYPLAEPVVVRALRIVNAADQVAPFAVRGLRAFGSMDKAKPSAPQGVRVVRDAADRRHATVTWEPVEGASGYLVRFGISPERRHLSRTTKACRVDIRSLDAKEEYAWSVAAYNEAGVGCGGTPH